MTAVRAWSFILHVGDGGGSDQRGWVRLGDITPTAVGNHEWAKNTTINYGKQKAMKEAL
jgi:hypothetical protein